MIQILGWLAALVAFVTSASLLSDAYLSRERRRSMQSAYRQAAIETLRGRLTTATRTDVQSAISLTVRLLAKIGVCASSLICLLMPITSGELTAGLFETLLRVCLAAYMASQVPCPWIRYVISPRQWRKSRDDGGKAGDVH